MTAYACRMRTLALLGALLFAAFSAQAQTLSLSITLDHVVDPALPFPVTVTAFNDSAVAGADVLLTIDLTNVDAVANLPAGCMATSGHVTCSLDTLPAHSRRAIAFQAIAPDASAVHIDTTAEVRASASGSTRRTTESSRTFTTFFVTNTDDSGSGSLRAAIESANASCTKDDLCKIAFRIPPGDAKWVTIRTVTPLPVITGRRLFVDGRTQTRYFGDSNPSGPEVELNGSALDAGSGLQSESGCLFTIRALTINGFPEAGIVIHSAPCADPIEFHLEHGITSCYLGVDPTGSSAVPNGRGAIIGAPGWTIDGNVIGGNRRSGLWIDGRTLIVGNIIGLNPDKTAPLGNGASGIYVSAFGAGTDINDNFIGFNHHAGVSVDRAAYAVALSGNSIQANEGLAIDYGLDGPTSPTTIFTIYPRVVPGDPIGPKGIVNRPEITSAVYDAAKNQTTIEGTVGFSSPGSYETDYAINVYANDAPDPSGFGEGQYFLGIVSLGSGGSLRNQMPFKFVWPGRPPGPWIAATATAHWFYFPPAPVIIRATGLLLCDDCSGTTTTTEFSRTVRIAE